MPATRTVNVTDDVKAVLANAIIGEDRLTLPDQLDRPLYVKVDKVLKAAGGKWNTKVGAHLFNGDPRQILGIAMETGAIVDDKKSRQAFYTPEWLAEELVAHAGIDDERYRVLEPSAGDGVLVKAAIAAGATHVVAFETDEMECEKLWLLETADCRVNVFNCDFGGLEDVSNHFDACVMNPPFDHAVEHFTKAASMVSSDGFVASIMPATIRFSSERKWSALRDHIECVDGRIIDNPDDAFVASGTGVRTCTVVMKGGFKLPPKQLILL